MAYCLIKPLADAFKKALKEGKIDPAKLSEMTSKERSAFFEDIIGVKDAQQVNALFEKALLRKNVEQGMISWVKELTGMKPEAKRLLIERIEKMDERILNPATQQQFLEALAEQRLGLEVTFEEAKKITELSKKLKETKENYKQDPAAYGVARVEMENFLNDIRREGSKLSVEDFKQNAGAASVEAIGRVAGVAKSLKASLDMSAFLRQGGKVLVREPGVWARNVVKTFKDTWETLKRKTSDETVMDGLKAEIYSRENSFNGLYDKMKLAIGTGEEAFPTSIPEKIPGFGRFFKGSETAYNGFLMRLRADMADSFAKMAEKNGIDLLTDRKNAEAVGQIVNSMTGRGKLNLPENVNALFFSPKFLKANLDFFTAHQFEGVLGRGNEFRRTSTPFSRKIARGNLLRYLGATATVAIIASRLWPNSVETDPRSSDFGKIKIGNTRFDISGGISPVATLIARLATLSSKSSTTGSISEVGEGFGKKTVEDLLTSFAANKLAPGTAALLALLKRTDRNGDPITALGLLNDLFTPLPIQNAIETAKDPNAAPLPATVAADFFGIATNTYGDSTKVGQRFVEKPELAKAIHDLENVSGKSIRFEDWDTTKLQDVLAFKASLKPSDWESAKARYDFQLKERVEAALASEKFKNWTPEDKATYINQIDTEAKEKVFSQFNYKYAKPKGLPKKKKLKL